MTERFVGYPFIHALLRVLTRDAPRVLETGAGAGFYKASVRGCYVGTDITARPYHAGIPRQVDVVCQAERLPFLASTFDLVFCVASLDYILDLDAVFTEARRVITPGGRFLVVTYHERVLERIHRQDPEHRRIYNMPELGQLFARAGFKWRLLDGPEPSRGWKRALLAIPGLRLFWRRTAMWRVVLGTLEPAT